MEQERLNSCDDMTEDRRGFLKQCAALAGGGVAACVVLSGSDARADIVAPDDPRLSTERITYPAQTGQMRAYLARPKGQKKLPAVIVIHENRGLNAHTRCIRMRAPNTPLTTTPIPHAITKKRQNWPGNGLWRSSERSFNHRIDCARSLTGC